MVGVLYQKLVPQRADMPAVRFCQRGFALCRHKARVAEFRVESWGLVHSAPDREPVGLAGRAIFASERVPIACDPIAQRRLARCLRA